MNKITPYILLFIIISCGEKGDSHKSDPIKISDELGYLLDTNRNLKHELVHFSYSIDTVPVDVGDDFLYLNSGLSVSDRSHDGKYLYNFDKIRHSLQIIDLENHVLEQNIPLELDGPNGIGSEWISNLYSTTKDNILLTDHYQVSIIDKEGNKSLGFLYDKNDFEGNKLPEGMRIGFQKALSKDGNMLFTTYTDHKLGEPDYGIAWFDLEKKRFGYKPLEVFKELENYRSNLYINDTPMATVAATIHIQSQNDSLIFSYSVKNELHFYNLATDSFTKKIYKSKYTSDHAEGNYPKRTETQQEFQEVLFAYNNKEIKYGQLIYDDINNVYWRFSRELKETGYLTVLTAFDPSFNQLQEELLPKEYMYSNKPFARGGMIYTPLIIKEDLSFVRIKPTISYE